MFYVFDQNNSSGFFDYDKNLTKYVIVEADSAEEANGRAMMLGIYFNGVDRGLDCPCCGDRWYPVDEREGDDEPLLYDKSPEKHNPIVHDRSHPYCRVFYQNGAVKEYRTQHHTY